MHYVSQKPQKTSRPRQESYCNNNRIYTGTNCPVCFAKNHRMEPCFYTARPSVVAQKRKQATNKDWAPVRQETVVDGSTMQTAIWTESVVEGTTTAQEHPTKTTELRTHNVQHQRCHNRTDTIDKLRMAFARSTRTREKWCQWNAYTWEDEITSPMFEIERVDKSCKRQSGETESPHLR